MKQEYKYLVMVTRKNNHNRYYKMIPKGNVFEVEYGGAGSPPIKKKYPIKFFESTYNKKLKSGYVDMTHNHISGEKSDKFFFKEKEIESLFLELMQYSKQRLEKNYASPADVTSTMIENAKAQLSLISGAESVEDANDMILDLFRIVPRKMANVADHLITDMSEIPNLLFNEYELLDNLSGQVSISSSRKAKEEDFLKSIGLRARLVTEDKTIDQIRSHMTEMSPYFDKAYRIENLKRDKMFYDYMEKNGYTEKDIHYLYHGSRNANIFSICKKGLVHHPNAIKTGSMFGAPASYFAPRAKKSVGYSSLIGENPWTHERSHRGYLMVFKVLYKNQKDVYRFSHECTRFNARNILPHDAVFAHKGKMLFNDEVIVYREAQCTMQYLISLKK